jgi:hypothetical protein
MPLFVCRWPDKTFTVVEAQNATQAIVLLDDIGEAERSWIVPIENEDFYVTFRLDDGEAIISKQDDNCLLHDLLEKVASAPPPGKPPRRKAAGGAPTVRA